MQKYWINKKKLKEFIGQSSQKQKDVSFPLSLHATKNNNKSFICMAIKVLQYCKSY